MHFTGDTVVIDPGYVFLSMEDIEKSQNGEHMEALGFSQSFCYIDKEQKFAQTYLSVHAKDKSFDVVSNSGAFIVVYLEDLMKYNPDFKEDLDSSSFIILKDFDGDVEEVKNKLIIK